MYISNIKNRVAKRLLKKFWAESDGLHYDIDTLSFDQFVTRYKYLQKLLDKAMALEGCTITVNLYNLIEKAKGKYGSMFDNKFSETNSEKLVA